MENRPNLPLTLAPGLARFNPSGPSLILKPQLTTGLVMGLLWSAADPAALGACGRVVSKAQTRELPYRPNLRGCSEVTVSAISCTKLDVASKGAAWPAPSISCVVAVGMAAAREWVRLMMLSGLRAP